MSTYSGSYVKHLWSLKGNCSKFQKRLLHNYKFIKYTQSSTISSNSLSFNLKFSSDNFNQSNSFINIAHSRHYSYSLPLSSHNQVVQLQLRSISSQVDKKFQSGQEEEEEGEEKHGGSKLVKYSTTNELQMDGSHDELYEGGEEDKLVLEELHKEEIWNVSPFVPASSTFGPYANDSELIKNFVRMGVDVHKWEEKYGIAEFVLKLDFQKDVMPYIKFLVDKGVESDRLGRFFSMNPFILKEDLKNLKTRIKYLQSKKFSEEAIIRIIDTNPYWLSFSVQRIDRRLGFFQEYFSLTGNQVRQLAKTGPKLITGGLGRVKDIAFTVKESMGFKHEEIVTLLLTRPRIFQEKQDKLWETFDYLHNEVKFSHEQIVNYPNILLCRKFRLQNRIGFLKKVGRAQFDAKKPNYVSFMDIIEKDDATFAVNVAKSSSLKYNEYLKSF